jgi:flagellar hook-associated protein 1
MGLNFSPFEIGRRALHASQMGLQVAGNNIANVNTPGYTRQAVKLSPTPGDGLALRGVTIDGVQSFRDKFIESRLQTETAISGKLTAKRDALAPVDSALNQAEGAGLNASITAFFSAYGDLEAHPTSVPVRATVAAKGSALAAAFNSTRQRLVDIRSATDGAVQSTVGEVNELASRVADLNAKISIAENTQTESSSLRDQRGEIVRQLSEKVGTRAIENQDGTVTLTLADGQALVIGNDAIPLQAQTTQPDGLTSILLNGQPAAISDGRLRGLLDGITEINEHITALDDLASALATRVNTLHTSGSDLNGNAGVPFFAVPAGGAPITAGNLAVSSAITSNPALVVAAASGSGTGDASVARSISSLLTDSTSQAGTRVGTFSYIFGSIVGDVGASVRAADDALVTHQAILAQTNAQRESVSGVSLDEEAINLLQYQKAYEAAARFLKIADEVTQTILALGS